MQLWMQAFVKQAKTRMAAWNGTPCSCSCHRKQGCSSPVRTAEGDALHTSSLYNLQVSSMSLGSQLAEQRTCPGQVGSGQFRGHQQRGSWSRTLPCYMMICDFVRPTVAVVMVMHGCWISKEKGACANRTRARRRGEARRGEALSQTPTREQPQEEEEEEEQERCSDQETHHDPNLYER